MIGAVDLPARRQPNCCQAALDATTRALRQYEDLAQQGLQQQEQFDFDNFDPDRGAGNSSNNNSGSNSSGSDTDGDIRMAAAPRARPSREAGLLQAAQAFLGAGAAHLAAIQALAGQILQPPPPPPRCNCALPQRGSNVKVYEAMVTVKLLPGADGVMLPKGSVFRFFLLAFSFCSDLVRFASIFSDFLRLCSAGNELIRWLPTAYDNMRPAIMRMTAPARKLRSRLADDDFYGVKAAFQDATKVDALMDLSVRTTYGPKF